MFQRKGQPASKQRKLSDYFKVAVNTSTSAEPTTSLFINPTAPFSAELTMPLSIDSTTIYSAESADPISLVIGAGSSYSIDAATSSTNVTFQYSSTTSSSDTTDIGHALIRLKNGEALSTSEIRNYLTNRWIPTSKDQLPFSKRGTERRFLGLHHLNTYRWLAVSRVHDMIGAWCVWCCLFKVTGKAGGHNDSGGQHLGVLVNKPLVKFHNLTGKKGDLELHQNTRYHLRFAEKVNEFLLRTTDPSFDVRNMLDTSRRITQEENRTKLRPIVDTVLLCARQNIPLRGHRDCGRIIDETDPEENDGNFRALLRMRMRAGDRILKEQCTTSRGNSMYISPLVQNGLLDAALVQLRNKILKRISQANCWALLCDETMDRSKREQLVIVVRYVSMEQGKVVIREDPVCLMDILKEISVTNENNSSEDEVRLSGINIASVLKEKLKKLELDMSTCVGFGFDGASCMSSQAVGVASQLQVVAPVGMYFHCMMHLFNLCASQSVNVPIVRNNMDIVKQVTTFINSSPKRFHLLQHIIEDADAPQAKKSLKTLCPTRFVERHDSILTFVQLLPFVVTALERMSQWDSRDTRVSSQGLLHAVANFECLISITSLAKVTAILVGVSRSLQNPGMDITSALMEIRNAEFALKNMRQKGEEEFTLVYDEAVILAEKMAVSVKRPRTVSRSVFRDNAGCNEMTDVKTYYRRNMFLPLLDGLIRHINERFGDTQRKSLSLGCLIPAYIGTFQDLLSALDTYSSIIDSHEHVRGEFVLWRQKWITKKEMAVSIKTAIIALENCCITTMPNIYKLLCVLATLPVTTAEPERVFSKVDKTASASRTCMNEERLEALVLL